MVSQALIISGGKGTRMPPTVNTRGSKSLISYAGQSMLAHLLDGLREGGIDRCVISVQEHNEQQVKEIVKEKGANAEVFVANGGFRRSPWELKEHLDERCFLVCGHHPLPGEFVGKMLKVAEGATYAIASYDNCVFPLNKNRRLIVRDNALLPVESNVDPLHWYARNPYVIDTAIVNASKEDCFNHTFSHYLFECWKEGVSLGIVPAPMPPEFDYDFEFEATKKFLDGTLVL